MKPPANILLISTFPAPFIDDDIGILRERHTVVQQMDHGFRHIRHIIFKSLRAQLVVCWFASVYSAIAVMMAKLLGNGSIIIIGGVDVARVPELNYGIWLSRWKSRLVRYAIRNASRVVVGEPSLKDRVADLAGYDAENVTLILPGFDPSFWKPAGKKKRSVLTVAAVDSPQRINIKGIKVLLDAACELSDVPFTIVGITEKIAIQLKVPSNVTILPPLPRPELLRYYQDAQVYCQPSLQEAVSYTLREAMLCGCIPVASDLPGMRAAAAGVGFLVTPGDIFALSHALRNALAESEEAGSKARSRIVSLFPWEKRATELHRLVEGLLR